MNPDLLATKLHPPSAHPKRFQRPQLMERLNEGLAAGRQMTLISAPAGFGKTTCASEWVNHLDLPVAWLSLDSSDDDPGRFFPYFVAALQRVDQDLGGDIECVLRSGELPPGEAMITALINDILHVDQKFLLVLDDFQVIQNSEILKALDLLVANQPEQLHLVLITREDPVLPLARLRANNQLTELRASDLRFNSGEVDHFLNEIMGLSLSDADIHTLENRTEGWAVGLQLAAIALKSPAAAQPETAAQSPTRGRADPSHFINGLKGSHRYILSYLTEEVLSRQPEEIQAFLLQTSILDQLSGELCDAVTGRTDSSVLLERLLNANLFLIPLDDDQHWYRYHHLFADLLRNQQARIQKEQVIQLHQHASLWYEQAGMAAEAIEHALAASDYRHAVQLLELHASRMVNQGYVKTVEEWMKAIPPEWRSQSLRANLAFAWMHLLRGSYSRIDPYMNQVEATLTAAVENASLPEEEIAALRGEWYALKSSLLHVQGKEAESRELAIQALHSALPEDFNVRGLAYFRLGSSYREAGEYGRSVEAFQKAIQNSRAAGNMVSEMLAVAQLALMAIQNGQLHFAAEVCSQAIDYMERESSMTPPIAGAVYGALGLVYYEWNLIEKARDHLLRGVQLSGLGGHNAGVIYNKVSLARVYLAGGDLEAAARTTQEAVDLLQFGAPTWIRPEVASQRVRIELARGNPFTAETALKEYGISVQDHPLPQRIAYPFESLYLALLRLVLYGAQEARRAQEKLKSENLQQGIELADSLIAAARKNQHMGTVLQALLLRALMNSAQGNTAAIPDDLQRALELAEPQGYIRTFIDEGPQMAVLLKLSLERASRPAYVKKLLSVYSPPELAPTPLQKSETHVKPEALREPISDRELEVLRLMAEGLKYEEIAEKLVISLNTVRFHVKGIYSKLHADNRTKAIETARRLELL